MIIRPRDTFKLLGIFIMCACAVSVCALLLNSNLDLARIKDQIAPEYMEWYDIMLSSNNASCAITGGALALTTVVMLFFYVKHYIDTHKSELGILKALGYSDWKIARSFWVFGLSVFAGALTGFCLSFALMPTLYDDIRAGGEAPQLAINFNPILLFYLVILPAMVFALLAILYSYRKLKCPPLELIRGKGQTKVRKAKSSAKNGKATTFLRDLRRSTLKSRFSLVFFIWLAAFTYAATIVMSFSMDAVNASGIMGVMMAVIGIILAVTTLYIAAATIIKGNAKTIAMLRVFGYSDSECSMAILSGYRPMTYIGFAVGTAYQHGLMIVMMSMFYDAETLEFMEYSFNAKTALLVFASFVVLYEIFMWVYSGKIKRASIKEVMLEE